jgi:hypothetical protein
MLISFLAVSLATAIGLGVAALMIPKQPEILIGRLRDQAALRGISHAALAAALLETIVRDGLYEAVLDDS